MRYLMYIYLQSEAKSECESKSASTHLLKFFFSNIGRCAGSSVMKMNAKLKIMYSMATIM